MSFYNDSDIYLDQVAHMKEERAKAAYKPSLDRISSMKAYQKALGHTGKAQFNLGAGPTGEDMVIDYRIINDHSDVLETIYATPPIESHEILPTDMTSGERVYV